MSWLYSRALVAEYSAGICSDGEPSAPLNGNPTPQAYCAPDKMTAFSRLSRFGMTYAALTADHGEAVLTSFLAAFPARTSAPQGGGQALTAPDPACGEKWPESSVKYCLASSSWKTHRCLWDEALPWSSVTLPRWGMTRNGVVLAHPTSARPISATDSGLWDTPMASMGERGGRGDLLMQVRGNPSPSGRFALPMWQTPVADDACNRAAGKWNSRGEPKLSAQVLWPTPLANEGSGGGKAEYAELAASGIKRASGAARSLKLRDAVKAWPTPTRRDYKGPNGPDGLTRKDGKSRMDQLPNAAGGQLNPTWVEWLMGWPLGWTDLKPLETARFREWQQQHGESYAPDA